MVLIAYISQHVVMGHAVFRFVVVDILTLAT
jgi:hypothetical protein